MGIRTIGIGAAVLLCAAGSALAQDAATRQAIISQAVQEGARIQVVADGTVITPASSIGRPEDIGRRMHTFHSIFVPNKDPGPQTFATPLNSPPYPGYSSETPSSLACIHKLVTGVTGCNPNTFHTNTTGGSKAVGIVDAYHAPNVRTDLNAYSTQFGLPQTNSTNFVIWYCGTTLASCNQKTPPAKNTGWAQETTLDVEMVHALAPKAKIILVEARSASNNDLLVAVQKASTLVAAAGGGQLSMSWGGPEFSSQNSFDSRFTTSKVVYFASSGDDPGTSWPSVSAKVVSVGGTTIARNSSHMFVRESSWTSAGGGPSKYVARPSYQPASFGTKRRSPDISAVANPSPGVWVRYSGGWYMFGGTSVSSPLVAAIVNNAGLFRTSSASELSTMYAGLGVASKWYDVTVGKCGPSGSYSSKAGYDYCGGIGSPRSKFGK